MPQDRKALTGIEQTCDRSAEVTLVTGTGYVFVFVIIGILMRSHPAQSGATFDDLPTLERSGSEHRRAVTHYRS